MPTDYVEMFWGCTICKAENKGRFKTCQGCGKPRTEASPEWMPGDISPMAAVKDPELIRKASAGADWSCRFCGSSQFRADGNCAQCGSEQAQSTGNVHEKSIKDKACRGELTKDDIERMLQREARKEPDPFPAPQDLATDLRRGLGASGEEPAPFIENTGSYRDPPKRKSMPTPPPVEAVEVPIPKIPFKPPNPRVVGGVVAALAAVLALYFVFRTKVVNAEVATLSWDRTVSVDRYEVYQHEGWEPNGSSFDVRQLGQRIHHYDHILVGHHQERDAIDERYQCGTNTVRGRCYTTPRNCEPAKNGFAKCTGGDYKCDPDTTEPKYCTRPSYHTVADYRDEPRYQEWYAWKAWEWGHNRDVRSSGSNKATHWPSDEQIRLSVGLRDGEQERIAGRTEHYNVVLAYKDERFTYQPQSDSDFQRFSVGDRHKIKVGIAHGVEILP